MASDISGEVLTGVAVGVRGGILEGSVHVSHNGITWKRSGGGRTVEVPKGDIQGMRWLEIPRVGTSSGTKSTVLVVTRKSAATAMNFLGFPKSKTALLQTLGLGEVSEEQLSLKGHNWGDVSVEGSNLVFSVDGAPAFVCPLADVLQAQHGRDEVTIQMPVDDTVVDRNDDALAGISFYVPKGCTDFGVNANEDDEIAVPPSKKLYDVVKSFTMNDVNAEDIIASFDSVGVAMPRGRFDIEMYPSSLHLLGQAHDFRVQYDSIVRIFVLPKANSSQTVVAALLDPPIRKGQTTYDMILCQFHNDEDMTIELHLSDEALAARNEKGAKLTKTMSGPSPDVFAKILRGLSGAKLTRTGAFRDAHGDGNAVRCSYKNDDGHLYPLERAFFYLMKPPMLIPYDDIKSVEFMRQTTGISAAKTFDLLITKKNRSSEFRDDTQLFRSIPRSEWNNLFEWIRAKELHVENLQEVENGPSAKPQYDEFEISDDELDEEEEDFDDEDFGEPSEDEMDDDRSDVSDADEQSDINAGNNHKSNKKRSSTNNGKSDRTKRKKKDKNAPKKALSAFMFYSNSMREKIKEENPGIAFTDVAKKIGEMWKNLGDDQKRPFEDQANADKERYAKEMEIYKATLAASEIKDDQDEIAVKEEI